MATMRKSYDEWIPLTSVEELYDDVNKNSFEAMASSDRKKGKNISHWYRSAFDGTSDRGEAMLNIGYFKHIWERRREIQFEAQDNYYRMLDYMKESELTHKFAKYMDISYVSSHEFFRTTLFANNYFINLSNTVISRNLIKFHNMCDEFFCENEFEIEAEEYDYLEAKKHLEVCCD